MTIDPGTVPDMLHWYEGMLLLPEHFQAAGRRQEMLSGYLTQFATPHGWGVRTIRTEIQDGWLRVLALEAVLPDGTMIAYRSDDPHDEPLEIDLKAKQAQLVERRKLLVHVVMVARSERIIGQDDPDTRGAGRYRSVRGAQLERDDGDMAAGRPQDERMRERPWQRPVLALYVNDGGLAPPPAKYVALPIARVYQNAETAMVFDRYEPPRTRIVGADELQDCAKSVAGELRAKAQFLSERLHREQGASDRKGAKGAPSIDTQLRLLNRRFQMLHRNVENLQALTRTVPRLEALMKDGAAHPFTLYLTLCDIVGDLALLGGDLVLPELPAYEHRDPLASFDVAERHIFRMLESLNQRFRVVAFERVAEGRFELAVKPGDFGDHFVIGAVRTKGEPASTVLAWMDNAVIATAEKLPDLKRRRAAGAPCHAIERDEGLDLGTPSHTSLFRVDATPEHIDRRDTVLVIDNGTAEGPMTILLYVPRDLPAADPASPEP